LATARNGLPKINRLLKPADFKKTLKNGVRWRNELFGACAALSPNICGRLGIIVSRKTSPRAVIRNRIKRQIRESFRHQKERFSGLDMVIMANPSAAKVERVSLRVSLQQLWDKAEKLCKKSS
jgi:ribonuclease P protein component